MNEPEPPVSLLRILELVLALAALALLIGPWAYAYAYGLLARVWVGS